MPTFYLFLAILSEVAATSCLKITDGCTRLGPSLIGVIGYFLCFYFLSLSLREIPMGVAYAIWAGVGIILIALVDVFFYQQTFDIPAIIGIVFIVLGVIILKLFSNISCL